MASQEYAKGLQKTNKEKNLFPHTDYILSPNLEQGLMSQGLDGMLELILILLNSAMQMEQEKYLRAGSYQRTEDRKGYTNGFKPKTVIQARIFSAKAKENCSMLSFACWKPFESPRNPQS